MNLLVGIAVSDISQIVKNSKEHVLKAKLQVILSMEVSMLNLFLKHQKGEYCKRMLKCGRYNDEVLEPEDIDKMPDHIKKMLSDHLKMLSESCHEKELMNQKIKKEEQ